MPTKTCIHCKTSFDTDGNHCVCDDCRRAQYRAWQRAHYEKNRQPKVKLFCKICGAEFEARDPRHYYCSSDCRKIGNKIAQTNRYVPKAQHSYRDREDGEVLYRFAQPTGLAPSGCGW